MLSVERVIPNLVIILVFVIAVGLGAFAGMLTLIVGTVGMFGKLFAKSIENADSAPADAIYSVGANKLQVIRYAIPQVLPSFIANFLYAMDINMRAAIGLGIFGGGIGFELHMAMHMMRYQDALPLIFVTILLVIAIEKLSDFFRRKILSEGKLNFVIGQWSLAIGHLSLFVHRPSYLVLVHLSFMIRDNVRTWLFVICHS